MNQPQATGSPFPDLSRAPFVILSEASPEMVANEIVACLQAVEQLERRTCRVFAAVAANVGMSPRDPLAVAGTRIAADLDDGVTGQARNAYHNSRHICEVLLCSLFLAKHAGLAGAQQARIAVAALVHDLHHDGTTNAGQPFRLERLAMDAARPCLAAAGVAQEEITRIAALVLATEVTSGGPYARCCFRHFHQGGPAPAVLPGADPLGLLATDPDLAFQAVLLAEADLLPSIALTYDHGMQCQERLSREDCRIAATPAQKLAFLDRHLAAGLLVAQFFEPNLEQLRCVIRASMEQSAGGCST
jgi:hypothetical protein